MIEYLQAACSLSDNHDLGMAIAEFDLAQRPARGVKLAENYRCAVPEWRPAGTQIAHMRRSAFHFELFFPSPFGASGANVRIGVVVALAAAIMLAIAASSVRSEISGRDAQALSKASLIYVATVRKDGNQSKAAPVWFTTSADNNAILIQTGPDTWKAKRIKRGSPVLVWIGSATGPAFIGRAEITSNATVQNKILDDFRQKYVENRVMGVGPSRAKFDSGDRVAIKIAPVRDLPDGFSSNPGTPPPLAAPLSAPGRSP